MMKKSMLALAAATVFASSLAQAAIQEGADYTVLAKPIPQLQQDKVEVLEFFSYSCVHCYHLDPILLKHSKSFATDTYLRTEHVVWDPSMLGLARIAAAVNASGTKYQANPAIFNAMFEQKANLGDPNTFKSWAEKQTGFDSAKLLAAFNSVNNPIDAKRMQDLTTQNGIDATPMLIVGGKYRVKMTDFNQGMQVLDELIAKVRQERGMKAAALRVAPKSIGAAIGKSANR